MCSTSKAVESSKLSNCLAQVLERVNDKKIALGNEDTSALEKHVSQFELSDCLSIFAKKAINESHYGSDELIKNHHIGVKGSPLSFLGLLHQMLIRKAKSLDSDS